MLLCSISAEGQSPEARVHFAAGCPVSALQDHRILAFSQILTLNREMRCKGCDFHYVFAIK